MVWRLSLLNLIKDRLGRAPPVPPKARKVRLLVGQPFSVKNLLVKKSAGS